ncbi:hypothetical protein O6H91_Y267000 [Diphasiastrum complanatum]|nr:hypothetical protein O6H91_Y267000 [Diphasiastrum complanatum]
MEMTSEEKRDDEAMDSESDSDEKKEGEPHSDSENSDEDENAQSMEVEQLKAAVAQNPNNYDAHVQYIGMLRKQGALEEVRQAREAMNVLFPLSSAMWREWTQDEARLISSSEDAASVEALYEHGVKEYLSVPLWVEYLEFVEEHDAAVSQCTSQGLAKMRALFERSLGAAGLHLAEGWKVWEAYREFEQAVLLTIAEDNIETKSKQVDIVRSIFRRQLTVPLANHADTLRDYREWEEQQGTKVGDEADELAGLPPNVVSSYAKAMKVCSKYKPIEELIASGKAGDAELLHNYQLYIGLEEDTGDPARVQVIYERAIADFPITSELWLKYTEYLDSNLKVPSIIKTVYARAVQNCPWVGELWKRYLLALERCGAQENEIFPVYEKSLQSGLQTPTEYLDLFLTRADSLRRMLKSESNETEKQADLKQLWETFDHASQFLTTYFPDYVDRSLQLYRYWARLAVHLGNDVMAARGVWENLIKSRWILSAHGWMTEVWKGYISMELELRNIKEARSIYRRCYSRKFEANGAELMCDEWLRFEREYGSLEDYDRAVLKVRPRLAEVKAMQLAQEVKGGAVHSSGVTTQAAATAVERPKGRESLQKERDQVVTSNKRKRGLGHKDYDALSKRQKSTKRSTKETIIVNQEKDPNQQEKVDTEMKADKSMSRIGHQSEDSKSSTSKQQVYTDRCTAFVSNIPFEVTEEQLHEFFSSSGGLKDVRMLRDRYTGRPRVLKSCTFFMNRASLTLSSRVKISFQLLFKRTDKSFLDDLLVWLDPILTWDVQNLPMEQLLVMVVV